MPEERVADADAAERQLLPERGLSDAVRAGKHERFALCPEHVVAVAPQAGDVIGCVEHRRLAVDRPCRFGEHAHAAPLSSISRLVAASVTIRA